MIRDPARERIQRRAGGKIRRRPEAKQAREAFVSSATSFVTPVTQIDDAVIGNGKAGSVGLGLRRAYLDYAAGPGRTA